MDNKDNPTNKFEKENDKEEVSEKFVIEYPINYNEIVERKLMMLEKDYTETINSNFIKEDEDNDESSEENNEESAQSKVQVVEITNNQYQCLMNDEEDFIEVKEEENFYEEMNTGQNTQQGNVIIKAIRNGGTRAS